MANLGATACFDRCTTFSTDEEELAYLNLNPYRAVRTLIQTLDGEATEAALRRRCQAVAIRVFRACGKDLSRTGAGPADRSASVF